MLRVLGVTQQIVQCDWGREISLQKVIINIVQVASVASTLVYSNVSSTCIIVYCKHCSHVLIEQHIVYYFEIFIYAIITPVSLECRILQGC